MTVRRSITVSNDPRFRRKCGSLFWPTSRRFTVDVKGGALASKIEFNLR